MYLPLIVAVIADEDSLVWVKIHHTYATIGANPKMRQKDNKIPKARPDGWGKSVEEKTEFLCVYLSSN